MPWVFWAAFGLVTLWALWRTVGEKRVTALFTGTCRRCGRTFKAGCEILWRKGKQPRHVNCRAAIKDLDAATAVDALLRMEALKTPAARRRVIRNALESISTPDERAQFILEASRIETDFTLERVASLKTSHARRRHLTEALKGLREDEVADALQAAEIAALEEALRAEEDEPPVPPQRAP